MITVESESFGIGIKHKNEKGIVKDVYFHNCKFSEHLTGMIFEGCIFEQCTMPPTFDKSNTLRDCIC